MGLARPERAWCTSTPGRHVRALDGVDLGLGPGERVGLIGQNGSGKTTLVRHLNGLLRPTEGRVTIDGRRDGPAHGGAARRARRARLPGPGPAALRQDRPGRGGLRPAQPGPARRAAGRAVAAALDAVGLAADAARNPYDLGYVPPQAAGDRVGAGDGDARGGARRADHGPGRPRRGARRGASWRTWRPRGGRSIVISHDMRFVAEHLARVVVMRAGRVILDGPPETVFAEEAWPLLASTYLEPPYAARVGARLGLGSTPTERSVVVALARRGRDASATSPRGDRATGRVVPAGPAGRNRPGQRRMTGQRGEALREA